MNKVLFQTSRIFRGVLRKRKITALLVVANLCVLVLFVTGWSSSVFRIGPLQTNKKRVEARRAPVTEPIQIVEPKLNSKAITLGEDFEEDDSLWLKHLTFKIRNKSDKPITYLVVGLDFPETQATGGLVEHIVTIGRAEDNKATLNRPQVNLKPNEEVAVSLDAEFDSIKHSIELRHGPVETINSLSIRIDKIQFEDGTRYAVGSFWKPNPNASGPRDKWIRVPESDRKPPSN